MKAVVTQTPQQKLLLVAQELGLKSLQNMQGTTRVVYDSVVRADNLTLFEGVSNRQIPLTNLDDNKFQVNEALAVEAIQIFTYSYNSEADPATLSRFANNYNIGVLNLIIGNQTVLKNVAFSPRFGNISGRSGAGGRYTLWLEKPIVIPPQVRFSVKLTGLGASGATDYAGVALYGTGVLLNLKNSL